MARIIRELGPLALVAVVVGAMTLWLLASNPGIGRWVLAVILFGHGWVHLMFLFPRPGSADEDRPATGKPAPEWPFDLRESWLATRVGSGSGALAVVGRVLVVVTFGLSTLAALATAGFLVPAAFWQGLVVASSLASLALLVGWFAPRLLLGILIDVALVWLAIAGPWSPA
jgi:hypothetical protein